MKKILVVDDDPSVLAVTLCFLAHRNFEAVGVTGVREAVDVLCREPDRFEVMVTDYEMPDANGIKLAAMVRALRVVQTWPALPMILMTGSGEVTEEMARSAGFCALLRKPCRMSEIEAAIRLACDAEFRIENARSGEA